MSEHQDWSEEENRLIVEDYFDMLDQELQGKPYSKTEHRTALIPMLNKRSKGSVEFKHQNISAVLSKSGLPYIQGYKPRHNVQSQLGEAIEAYLNNHPDFYKVIETKAIEVVLKEKEHDYSKALTESPKLTPKETAKGTEPRKYIGRMIDYAKRESENRSLGLKGEEFVLGYEKWRLSREGRDDLAQKVIHVSQEQGDGAGYDILSFNVDETEKHIEVKTTKVGKELPFYMSNSEKEFLEEHKDSYCLYRVYDFDNEPRLFILSGDELDSCVFAPSQYRVSLGGQ